MILKDNILQDHLAAEAVSVARGKDATPPDVTAANVATARAHLTELAKAKLAVEIHSDPAKRGYGGRSPEEIANLINACAFCEGSGNVPEGDGWIKCIHCNGTPSRVGVFWHGISYAKNAVDADDVREALRG